MEKKASLGKKELYAVLLLAIINFFLFADQNLMAPNLTQIAHEFGFSDVERDVKLGGNISFVFWVLGAMVTLGIGYLTDRLSRKQLFIATVLVGSFPCFLTGFAHSYTQLFWLRALTGIGIGGIVPLTYSLIGDYFSHRNRAIASAWISLSLGLGVAMGQLIAGFMGPAYGWRLPFIIVGLPNFVLIFLFWLTVKEPPRGITEDSLKELIERGLAYTGKINWSLYREIFKIKTNLLVFLQGIPGCIPWGVFFIFLNDYFAQDKGFTVESATVIVMAAGAACILGGFSGGLIGQWFYNKGPKYMPLFAGVAAIMGTIPTAFLLNYPSQAGMAHPNLIPPLIIAALAGFTNSLTGANVSVMVLNVNAPETRGSMFSLYNLTDALGKGFGPVVISLFISSLGRDLAFNIANLFWVICGLIILVAVWTFPKDEAALDKLLKKRAESMLQSHAD
jgi:MFS family permease